MAVSDEVRPIGPRQAPDAIESQFERTPPQDIAAEQCVLGGMLLSKDAIADVVEILRSNDFYKPAHAIIYDAILDLYGRGEPADPITVSAALAQNGQLAKVGGAPYLHTLIASVPTAANASYYAKIVAERAVLRRLVEAGTRIVQLGYGAADGAGRDVDEVVDLAQQAIYDVTERRVAEDFALLSDLLQPTLDEIESIGANTGELTGAPTGFTDLDRLLGGLHPGQLIVVAGRPGLGKALALDTPLPTPDGWTTMGEVRPGDRLLGSDGTPTTVVAATEVLYDRPCYEVVFSDGSVLVADASHQWLTRTSDGVSAVRTTEQIAATLDAGHWVSTAAALQLPEQELPVSPYVLGVWLAGADLARVTSDPAKVHDQLRRLGVSDHRHIPMAYLRASEPQRRDLLAGLLDEAGEVAEDGLVQLTVVGERLAADGAELLASLGYRCEVTPPPDGSLPRSRYVLTFATSDEVFRAADKQLRHKRRKATLNPQVSGSRAIVGVRRIPSVPVRCVQVDSADHLYLAGRSMIPTHNSTVAMDFIRAASIRHGLTSLMFSLEMSKIEIVMRLLAAESRVPLHVLRSGQLSDDDWTKLARRMGEISEAPLFIDDTPNMTLMEIRAKARRLKQRNDLRLIVVDYLQLMTTPKRVESRQQEVAELSRGLKLLAKEIECPVVAVSQLNRGPEQRTDKRPQLSDLRESGSIEQDADVVILLHRDDYYDKESPRAGEADFIVAKHRNGPTDTVTVAAQLHLSRFVDMAV